MGHLENKVCFGVEVYCTVTKVMGINDDGEFYFNSLNYLEITNIFYVCWSDEY